VIKHERKEVAGRLDLNETWILSTEKLITWVVSNDLFEHFAHATPSFEIHFVAARHREKWKSAQLAALVWPRVNYSARVTNFENGDSSPIKHLGDVN